MNVQLQKNHKTLFNRYPELFMGVKEICQNLDFVLSFGSSTGQEAITLAKYYYPNATIHGVDIDKNIVEKATMNAADHKLESQVSFFTSDSAQWQDRKYDIIFALSVLCMFPGNVPLPLKKFKNICKQLDKKLQKGGYLVLYNANYMFWDLKDLFEKYLVIDHQKVRESGFVPKFTFNGKHIPGLSKDEFDRNLYSGKHRFCIFKKVG